MKKLVASLMLMVTSSTQVFALSELDNRIWEASQVLQEYMRIPEESIPPSLLKEAQAIAIFPSMIKGGFIVAGQYGDGVILHRDVQTGEWSAPSFVRMSGASVGLQAGGSASDVILVVTSERGVRGLLSNKFTLGADASVAAGPVGRDAEAKTDWQMKSSIFSYSRSKGLFAGIALDGMVINQDIKANQEYYGSPLTAEEILMQGKATASAEAQKLIQLLKQYV